MPDPKKKKKPTSKGRTEGRDGRRDDHYDKGGLQPGHPSAPKSAYVDKQRNTLGLENAKSASRGTYAGGVSPRVGTGVKFDRTKAKKPSSVSSGWVPTSTKKSIKKKKY